MHHVNRNRAFTHRRRHSLHISRPDIAHRKHPRQARFQHIRRTRPAATPTAALRHSKSRPVRMNPFSSSARHPSSHLSAEKLRSSRTHAGSGCVDVSPVALSFQVTLSKMHRRHPCPTISVCNAAQSQGSPRSAESGSATWCSTTPRVAPACKPCAPTAT